MGVNSELEPESPCLHGMSFAHEIRLRREGFDNVENLAHADAIDLAVRCGFPYTQLREWIDQAWLRGRLGEDYDAFWKYTGIGSGDELTAAIGDKEGNILEEFLEKLAAGMPEGYLAKLSVVASLLGKRQT